MPARKANVLSIGDGVEQDGKWLSLGLTKNDGQLTLTLASLRAAYKS